MALTLTLLIAHRRLRGRLLELEPRGRARAEGGRRGRARCRGLHAQQLRHRGDDREGADREERLHRRSERRDRQRHPGRPPDAGEGHDQQVREEHVRRPGRCPDDDDRQARRRGVRGARRTWAARSTSSATTRPRPPSPTAAPPIPTCGPTCSARRRTRTRATRSRPSCARGSTDNCSVSNADYDSDGYFYGVEVPDGSNGTLNFQAFDPEFAHVGDNCGANDASNGAPASDLQAAAALRAQLQPRVRREQSVGSLRHRGEQRRTAPATSTTTTAGTRTRRRGRRSQSAARTTRRPTRRTTRSCARSTSPATSVTSRTR